jgi:GNAT superfamily N-acetyltransferase
MFPPRGGQPTPPRKSDKNTAMLAPIDVARLEETRASTMLAAMADEARDWAGGTMGFSGPGTWLNQVMGAGLGAPVGTVELDDMVEFYESRGVEARIELCPFADESLTAGLSARDFTVREFQNVLCCEIGPTAPQLPLGWPPRLEVRLVDRDDASAVQELVQVSLSGFFPAGEPISEVMRRSSMHMLSMARTRGFIATLDGAVVGGGLLDLGESAANLAGTSVLPEARRRGVQQALILARLQAAREYGCRVATIASKPGIPTERNAMRLGFAMAYTKVVLARSGAGLLPSP